MSHSKSPYWWLMTSRQPLGCVIYHNAVFPHALFMSAHGALWIAGLKWLLEQQRGWLSGWLVLRPVDKSELLMTDNRILVQFSAPLNWTPCPPVGLQMVPQLVLYQRRVCYWDLMDDLQSFQWKRSDNSEGCCWLLSLCFVALGNLETKGGQYLFECAGKFLLWGT